MTEATDASLLNRAISAAAREAAKAGGVLMQPASGSGVQEVNGKRYVVLRNVGGILAVYRVRTDGILKGMKRWPKELEQAGTEGDAPLPDTLSPYSATPAPASSRR